MRDAEKQAIDHCEELIVRDAQADLLINKCRVKQLLSQDDYEELSAVTQKTPKIIRFLTILKGKEETIRGESTFKTFLKIFSDNHQSHIANALEAAERSFASGGAGAAPAAHQPPQAATEADFEKAYNAVLERILLDQTPEFTRDTLNKVATLLRIRKVITMQQEKMAHQRVESFDKAQFLTSEMMKKALADKKYNKDYADALRDAGFTDLSAEFRLLAKMT